MERPAARVGHDARRVRGGVAAPTGARRGAAVSQRRRRHVAGGDGLGEQPEATSSPRCGSPRRYRSASSASDARSSPHCSSDSDPRVEPWFVGDAYSALGNLAFEQGDWAASSESHAAAAEQFLLAGSARDAAWATYFGVYAAWGTGDLTKADALVRQAIDGFRSDGDTMGLGYALCRRRAADDGSRRGPATRRRSRRAPASDRLADGHRPHRRRTRDHRLRPG